MGPFDPTRNTQLCIPGKEWRALTVSPAVGNPHDCSEYKSVNNCWRCDGVPAIDTGNIHTEYINKLIKRNQETDKWIEALCQAYKDYYFFDNEQRALWSSGIRPTYPTSEHLDKLWQLKEFSLTVDGVSKAQHGVKDKHAFIDYVAHLHQERFWMPDSVAKVKLADKQYLGVWLNETEEWTACWYLKEGTPCFVVWEILPPKHAQLTAQETMIDFSAGTSSSSTHWNINEYDARS